MKILPIVLAAVVLCTAITGCAASSGSGGRYKVDYSGSKGSFSNAEDSYAAGTEVELTFTDASSGAEYAFYVDGMPVTAEAGETEGLVIRFTMPSHDISVHAIALDPAGQASGIPQGILILIYSTGISGTDGFDERTTFDLLTYDRERAVLRITRKADYEGDPAADYSYYVPFHVVTDCYALIAQHGFAGWKDLKDTESIDGGFSTVIYAEDLYSLMYDYEDGDDISYTRVSTDAMPSDGQARLDSIHEAIIDARDEWVQIEGPAYAKSGSSYDFIEDELSGVWLEYGTENTAFFFTGDTVTVFEPDGSGDDYPYSVSGQDGERQIAVEGLTDLAFRRRGVNGWSIGFLFTDDKVYVNERDARFCPDGYVPDPDVESRPDEEQVTFDTDELKTIFGELIVGEWVCLDSDDYQDFTVTETEISWTDRDGERETHDYRLSPYAFTDKVCGISMSGSFKEYIELEYREKTISGNAVRMLIGTSQPPGSSTVDTICVLVKKEDADLLPEGYESERHKDDSYVYRSAVRERKLLFLEDVLDAGAWVGKNVSDLGIDQVYIDGSDSKLDFSGFLFGAKASGRVYETDGIYDVSVYTYDLSFDECTDRLTGMYGEPEMNETPYVAGDGSTLTAVYDAGDCHVYVSTYSEKAYLEITFRR